MRNITLILFAVVTLLIGGCSDDSKVVVPKVSSTPIAGVTPTTPTTPTPTTPTTPTPTTPTTPGSQYITFRVNGTLVTETVVTATSSSATNPRTMTITGTGAGGTVPKFKFFLEEPSIGFERGSNVGNTEYTYPAQYIEYTNSANVFYSTRYDRSGMNFFFLDISYTNGGTITGSFSGSIKTEKGEALEISEGLYSVKFAN